MVHTADPHTGYIRWIHVCLNFILYKHDSILDRVFPVTIAFIISMVNPPLGIIYYKGYLISFASGSDFGGPLYSLFNWLN